LIEAIKCGAAAVEKLAVAPNIAALSLPCLVPGTAGHSMKLQGGSNRSVCGALAVVYFAASALAVPLQYERIYPVGAGPSPRFNYGMVTLNSMEGMVLIYGGEGDSGILADAWKYDAPANAWSSLDFSARQHTTLVPANLSAGTVMCATNRLNFATPGARAGHSMTALGPRALVCGGYTAATGLQQYTMAGEPCPADAACRLDCWWLTALPVPRWDALQSVGEGGDNGPARRWGFGMASFEQGADGSMFAFIHGGMDSSGELLADCWFIGVPQTIFGFAPNDEFVWRSCSPAASVSLTPEARYGHTVVFHAESASLFISHGFAFNGQVCVYIYTCIHIYMYTYIHIYKHTYIHTYIRARTHTHTHTHTYIHTHTHIHTYRGSMLATTRGSFAAGEAHQCGKNC